MNQFISTINPTTNTIIREFAVHTPEEVEKTLTSAYEYQKEWKLLSFKERGEKLLLWAEILDKHIEELAELASMEMGKPFEQGIAELKKCIMTLEYYSQHAESILKDELVRTEAQKSYIHYSPLGVVLGVMPWNFPFWQVFRAFAPIVMCGNTFVLKHASQVTGCAVRLQELWDDCAALPKGLFSVIVVPGKDMDSIIAHPAIAAITFTGSTQVGAQIASIAGKHLKKHLLELGGSDAYIVLEDADINLAAEKCAASRLNNTGQSCIAAKRVIVHKGIADTLIQKLKDEFEKRNFGNPLEAENHLGPMSRKELRDEMHEQIMRSIKAGAIAVTGAFIPEGEHAFYPPTIVSHVKKGMPMYDEEIFGPALAVIIVENDEEAIHVANDTMYGLGGGIFTKDIRYAEHIAAEHLHTGFIAINDFVRSDPRLSFGGVKHSGYGRELSKFGMLEFCNIKTIYVR